MMKALELSALLLLMSAAQVAFGQQGPIVIAGAGTQSCGVYVESRTNPEKRVAELMMISWMQGYLSGWNSTRMDYKEKTFGIPDVETLRLYIEKSCRDKPLSNLYQIAIDLRDELGHR